MSRDKQKPLNLHYKSAYGNQTWLNGYFPKYTSTYNVTWPFDHVALWSPHGTT